MKRPTPILAVVLPGLVLMFASTAATAAGGQPAGSPSNPAPSATPPGLIWSPTQMTPPSDGNALGNDLAVAGDVAMIGSDNFTGGIPSSGAVHVYGKTNGTWVERQKLEPSQPIASGYFGTAIAISGTTAVIGQTAFASSGLTGIFDEPEFTGTTASPIAAAYLFEQRKGQWIETARLPAPDSSGSGNPLNPDRFAMTVAVDGGTVAVSASRHTVHPDLPEQGAVYLYADEGSSWQPVQKLVASDARGGDHFGSGLAIQGDTLLVGARNASRDRRFPNQGAVYVFKRINGVWTEQQRILAPSFEPSLQFGTSLAIEGDTALAGAPRLGDPMVFPPGDLGGKVYVLARQNDWWSVTQELQPSLQPRTYDAFGFRVGLSGDVAVSGAWQAFFTNGFIQQGVAHVYERVDGRWLREGKLTSTIEFDYGNFARGVAVSGRSLLATGKNDGVIVAFEGHRPPMASLAPESLRFAVGSQATAQASVRVDNPGDRPVDVSLTGPLRQSAVALQARVNGSGALNFAHDDGSADELFAFTHVLDLLWQGDEQSSVWLNRFAAPTGTGAFTLDSLSIFFPLQEAGSMVGKQVNLVAYYDADADGNPDNAVRLGEDHLVTIASVGEFATFDTDFQVPGDGDIYVGYETRYARGGSYPGFYPVAVDTSAPLFGHSWYATTIAPQVLDLADLSANKAQGFLEDTSHGGNFLIRATGSELADDCIAPAGAAWLDAGPSALTVPAGASATLGIAVDATGLSEGVHRAQLCVASNDPSRAMQRVPVTLTVLPQGSIFGDGFEDAP